jgi:putative heme-binding domain-containing protein
MPVRRDPCTLADSVAASVIAIVLAATAVSAQSPSSAVATGNAERGAAIVAGKGACHTCHRIGERGSRVGPNLTDIGTTRTAAKLQAALLDPSAEILPENRAYRVVTRDGATITGRLMNLDTYQALMIDAKEQLRSFSRAELREQGFVKESLMPSYRDTLSRQEQDDVIAYLRTLKGLAPQ